MSAHPENDYWLVARAHAKEAGAAIRQARAAADLSVSDVAGMIGRKPGSVGCWESASSRPGVDALRDLCRVLGLDFNAINGGYRWAAQHPFKEWRASLSQGSER